MKVKVGIDMKKKVFIGGIIGILLISGAVNADNQNISLTITPAEKIKLSQIDYNYNQQYDNMEKKITDYTNKINIVSNDVNKDDAQKSLLIGAYERNIETINAQKKQLDLEKESLYKSVLGDEKYIIYKSQQNDVQETVPNSLNNKEIKIED